MLSLRFTWIVVRKELMSGRQLIVARYTTLRCPTTRYLNIKTHAEIYRFRCKSKCYELMSNAIDLREYESVI